jgi:hypothetical protein
MNQLYPLCIYCYLVEVELIEVEITASAILELPYSQVVVDSSRRRSDEIHTNKRLILKYSNVFSYQSKSVCRRGNKRVKNWITESGVYDPGQSSYSARYKFPWMDMDISSYS